MFYKPRLRNVWFRDSEDKGGRWQVSRIESFVEGRVYEPGFKEWVRCEYTEEQAWAKVWGQEWLPDPALSWCSMNVNWVSVWVKIWFPWKAVWISAGLAWTIERWTQREEAAASDSWGSGWTFRTWSNREHLLVPKRRVTTLKQCLGRTPQGGVGPGRGEETKATVKSKEP